MSRGAFLPSCVLLGLALAGPAAVAAAPAGKPARISVTVSGSGPDVVLIPGLAASPGIWSSTVASVPGYRYHLVQVGGFAGAPAGGNAARGKVAAPVAEEIAGYISAAGLKRPAVVGHSMGGTIAMMIGARHPQAAGRVMVVDMLPSPARPFGLGTSAARPVARLIGSEWRGAERLRRELQGLAGRFGSADWMSTRSDQAVVGRSLEELIATDLTPELRHIRAPLTVVYACPRTLSFTCSGISRTFAGAYRSRPGTRLVRVEGSGHSIMLDQPAAFRAALTEFLRGG